MMAAGWSPWWDVVAVLMVGGGLTGLVAATIRRPRRRRVAAAFQDAGLRPPTAPHLLRKSGPIDRWRVRLADGAVSRTYLTRAGAMGRLRREASRARPAPGVRRADRPSGGLLWTTPTINRTER